jgi:hypothetical protein
MKKTIICKGLAQQIMETCDVWDMALVVETLMVIVSGMASPFMIRTQTSVDTTGIAASDRNEAATQKPAVSETVDASTSARIVVSANSRSHCGPIAYVPDSSKIEAWAC